MPLAWKVLINLGVLGFLILVHELGHFLAARWARMRIYEFSIGFGPPLLRWNWRGVLYSLRAIFFGGYVRIAGMDPDEDPHVPGGFMTRPLRARLIVLLAGALTNFGAALVIFCFMGMVLGVPDQPTRIIETVFEGHPAHQAGLQPGDEIVGVNGKEHPDLEDLLQAIRSHPGRPITLMVRRGSQRLEVTLTPRPQVRYRYDPKQHRAVPERIGLIGVGFRYLHRRVGLWRSIAVGLENAYYTTISLLMGLFLMLTGRAPMMLGGPVAIVKEVSTHAQLGLYPLLDFVGTISVNLAVLNLFPLPALDGGRIAFQLLSAFMERVRGRPLDPRKESLVHLVGFVLLVGFLVFITVLDIRRLAAP